MIHNLPYIDLEKHIDLTVFDSLHPEICRGITSAKHLSYNGIQKIIPGSINPKGQGFDLKPLYEVYSLWESLPEDDPFKINGRNLDYNQLSTYLKYAFGAYDLYYNYKLLDADFQTNGLGEITKYFPSLIEWILNFQTLGIFRIIHSATLMVLEAGGIPWEHCDPETIDDKDFIPEFIHIKTDLDRPFYMLDINTGTRTYINTRVAWWDERDWHGGEPINRPTYTLRINGRFSDDFKRKII